MGERERKHRRRGSTVKHVAIILAVPLLALTAGCSSLTGVTSHRSPTVAATRSIQVPTPAKRVIPAYPRIPTGTTVASGDFTAPGDRLVGHVEIVAYVGTDFQIKLTGVKTILSGTLQAGLVRTLTPTVDDCQSFAHPVAGPASAAPSQTIDLQLPDSQTAGDPTNLHYLTLAGDGSAAGCSEPILASAKLSWTWPKRYESIAVVDHGKRDGAYGDTTSVAGVLTSYTVANGDRQAAVLKRFGIDLDELLFLNPGSFQDRESSVPQAGFRWNLALADR